MGILPKAVKPTKNEHRLLLAALEDVCQRNMKAEELNDICYKWTMRYAWEDLEFVPLPSEPVKVIEWKHMGDKYKKALSEREFQRYESMVFGWRKHHQSVYNRNWGNLCWLYELSDYFESKLPNDERLVRINERINEFESKGIRKVAGA